MLLLWRDYNGRACMEQRIEELKHDLAADGFCLQPFFATEAAFLTVLFTFNLLSLYQHQTTPDQPYREPGTLRAAVFLCGGGVGRDGRRCGGQTLGGVGRIEQTQTAGGSDLGLAEVPTAEVDSARRSAGYRRRHGLMPRARSLENYRSTSEFGFKDEGRIAALQRAGIALRPGKHKARPGCLNAMGGVTRPIPIVKKGLGQKRRQDEGSQPQRRGVNER